MKCRGYFDGSVIYNRRKDAYCAFVLISGDGRIIHQSASRHRSANSQYAEGMALADLLRTALQYNIRSLEVFGDCQNIVITTKMRKQTDMNRHIIPLLDQFDDITIRWIKRRYNKYADKLCQLHRRGIPFEKSGGWFPQNGLPIWKEETI